MSKEWFPLDNVKVAAPCAAEWRYMFGNERVRFCGQCSQYVYNLSAMTRAQAEDLIRRHEGRLCVRFYRRKDGTIITNNCPAGLRALKAKYTGTKATLLKAALAFLAYLGVLAWFERIPVTSPVMGSVTEPVMGNVAMPDPVAFSKPVSKSESFIREKAIYKVTPVASSTAGNWFKGDAVVKVIISPYGEVERATLIKGPEGIGAIVEGAALRWEFQPMTEDGKPMRVESTLTFRFGSVLPEGVNRLPVRDKKTCDECL